MWQHYNTHCNQISVQKLCSTNKERERERMTENNCHYWKRLCQKDIKQKSFGRNRIFNDFQRVKGGGLRFNRKKNLIFSLNIQIKCEDKK